MLKKYNQFKTDILLENINESVIYFSPEFRNILNRIKDNEIGKELLEIEVTDIKPDITFVDIDTERDDYLSFSTMRNVINNLDNNYKHLTEIENLPNDTSQFSSKDERIDLINNLYTHDTLSQLFRKSRNPLRIGKFVNKVLGGNYNQVQVEEFVNKLRAIKEKHTQKFLIVEGDDIAFWYKAENYAEIKGQLGNSCMREKSSSIFEIYTKNPEVCRMLILLEDGKLVGRSLIWKIDSKDLEGITYYMDRQYTIKESDVEKFRKYAIDNNWSYRSSNSYSFESVSYGTTIKAASMSVSLKSIEYDRYPYMDTFRRYNPSSNLLFNDDNDETENEGDYILDHTDGTYRMIEGGVWSEWHDRMIEEESAVWSAWANSYLDVEYAINITDGSRHNYGWYPDGCDDIVYDEWNDIYLHVDDTVYSEAYGYSLLESSAVEVIAGIDESDGEPTGADSNWYPKGDDDLVNLGDVKNMDWFNTLSERFYDWDNYKYAHSSFLTKNYQDKWIISAYEIEVYEVIGNDMEYEYLSKLDARILGLSIVDEETLMDKFEYYRKIEDILPEIKEKLESESKRINDKIEGTGQLSLFNDDDVYKSNLIKLLEEIKERIEEIEIGLFIN